MPPIRTPTIKPVKTERTHEENQERAYIAASRRSDRSLEARIESARRASEIHKKRTGRALRVTEQDVVNEEMYEEEDDDLPAQYRRLQSHLQTGSYEFNRRLQAYMTSQMGTRNALMEQGNFAGPYPNAPFFTNQFGQPQQPTMMNPQMLHYPTQGFRPYPYPMSPQGFAGMHNRSASLSTPQDFSNYMNSYSANQSSPHVSPEEQQRRMSLPPQAMVSHQGQQNQAPMRPPVSRSASALSLADGATASPHSAVAMPSPQATQTSSSAATCAPGNVFTSGNTGPMVDGSSVAPSFAPFSTSLPPETQQLLSQPTSMENPGSYNPYWFTGNVEPLSYTYKPNSSSSGSSSSGKRNNSMEQTLSLNPLDTNVSGHSPTSQGYVTSATTDGVVTPFSGTFSNYNFGAEGFFSENSGGLDASRSSSGHGSGNVTPSGADWTNFLEPFDETVTTH